MRHLAAIGTPAFLDYRLHFLYVHMPIHGLNEVVCITMESYRYHKDSLSEWYCARRLASQVSAGVTTVGLSKLDPEDAGKRDDQGPSYSFSQATD